jgi:hypothetical protein
MAVLLAGIAGCRTGRPQPAGTGDITFRLLWDGPADLDLMVIEPSGQKIWFGGRRSTTGGLLDVDCNFTTTCDHPIENVFWAKGTAPRGTYHYQVALANTHGAPLPVSFGVQILYGRRVATSQHGAIDRRGDVWGPFDAAWPR